MATYRILNSLVPMFEQKLNKFANKIAKLGTGSVTYTKSAPYRVDEKKDKFFNQVVVDIDVEGSYVISNYEFIASLEWIDEKGMNLVKKADDSYQVPEKYLTSTKCEHCGYERFRRYTVLLRNTETGEFIQVGKSCVKDFIGCDIGSYATYLSFWSNLESYADNLNNEDSNGYANSAFTPDSILLQAIEETKHHGYISKRIACELEYNGVSTTASNVFGIMNKITNEQGELLYPEYVPTEESYAMLATIKEFIANLSDDKDYHRNLKLLVSMSYITNSNLGLVVSAVGFYLRETAERAEKAEREDKESVSEFVGNIGERIQITSTPVCIFSSESNYGWVYIYKFVYNNNVFIWSTGKELDAETEITLKGTVKQHKQFGRVKETVITNCRIGANK